MSAFTKQISDLLLELNNLTQQVEALSADVDARIVAKIQESNLSTIVYNLLGSGQVPIYVDPAQVEAILNAKIASGEIGSAALTLGGKPASDYVLHTDLTTAVQQASVAVNNNYISKDTTFMFIAPAL